MPAAVKEPEVTNLSVWKTSKALGWSVIIFNDDVNSFQHVEDVLQRHLHFTQEKAAETAKKIHKDGKACVYTGHREKSEHYKELLCSEGLNAVLTK